MSTTMSEQQRQRSRQLRRRAGRASDAGMNEPRIAIRNLDFYYGSNRR